jgi:hypothetical protein
MKVMVFWYSIFVVNEGNTLIFNSLNGKREKTIALTLLKHFISKIELVIYKFNKT